MAGISGLAAPRSSSPPAGRVPRRMLRHATALSGLAAAAVMAAACSSAGGGTASSGVGPGGSSGNMAAAKGVVSTRHLSGIGTVLVNSAGMTIYTPKAPSEVGGKIKCGGPCLSFWFPVTATSAHPSASGLPGTLGTIRRADNGKTQLTYNGKPLYTFRLDTAGGQAHGNNYTDRFSGTSFTWEAVTASGQAGGAGAPAPSASYSYGSGY